MSYYRAALAAAKIGDLTMSARFALCSIALGEDAPSSMRLYKLLQLNAAVDEVSLGKLRKHISRGKYKKALRVRLPDTTKAHTIRGLLYAQLGFRHSARAEFAKALALDTGNDLAKRGLRANDAVRATGSRAISNI